VTEETVGGGSDWTPQELAGLGATCFGLQPEQVQDTFIIVTDKEGNIYQSHAIETHPTTYHKKARGCRLVYILSVMQMAAQITMNELHEEVHR
jgi:hypothetical protein